MGEVIRRNAAVDDIFLDVEKTLGNARARGGSWQARAEERLGPVEVLMISVNGRLGEAQKLLAPRLAALIAGNDLSDKLIGEVSDLVWNALGRPYHDITMALIFGGGIDMYTEGPTEQQPDRMDVLAELLEAGISRKLDPEFSRQQAARVRASSDELRARAEAVRGPKAKVEMLQQVRTAVARAAANELASLKRMYKADGATEAQIHAIIPDHPRSTSGPQDPPQGGTPA